MSPDGAARAAYLDGNAGMPLRPEACEALAAALRLPPGNPSSAHAGGRAARRVISEAREAVAALAGVRPAEVVFTSGATESNVLAVRGALAAAPRGANVVTTRAEHPSLSRLAERLEAEGVPVRRAPVDRHGRVRADDVVALRDDATALVSVCLAQSVTGAIQPVGEVAAALRTHRATLHCDAAQAPGRLAIESLAASAALLSLSAHKLGGPPGVGALVVREGARWLAPHGTGSQEGGRRPGTEAVPLVAAFGAAARAALADREEFVARSSAMLAPVAAFVRSFPGGEVLTPERDALANTLLVAFDGCPGDALLAALDQRGVQVSTGTACTSLARTPAEVLVAGGRTTAEAARAVRISTSWSTSAGDLDALVAALAEVVPRVRAALETSYES
jgi:cysteine desulfurase